MGWDYWPSEPPPPIPRDAGGPLRAVALHLHDLHSCALLDDGRVACWGYLATALPKIMPLMQQARGLVEGRLGLCALVREGDVRCLGVLLGPQYPPHPWEPHAVALPPVRAMAYGEHHGCAIDTQGLLRCWGANYDGELGVGRPGSGWHDARVVPLPDAVRDFSLGYHHTCACTVKGEVYCWGRDLNFAPLGLPINAPGRRFCGLYRYPCVTAPARVPGLTDIVGIATHGWTTCAHAADGSVYCWGDNRYGQLGLGHDRPATGPQHIPTLGGVKKLVFGGSVCALLAGGKVACWGYGQISGGEALDPCFDGKTTCATYPRVVAGIDNAVDLANGSGHACALLADERIACWGAGEQGQLGNGLTETRASPVWVRGFGGML